MKKLIIFLSFVIFVSTAHSKEIWGIDFPAGEKSFADEVISYTIGSYAYSPYTDTSAILGIPDETTELSLGNGGSIVVKFTDNSLTTSGNSNYDLWIFETDAPEEADIYISTNNLVWIYVGRVGGATSGIDIDSYVNNGVVLNKQYSYVKIVDIYDNNYYTGSGGYAGADIDAIGAISSTEPICDYKDTDDDGVIDILDACQGTPINSYVNKTGCKADGIFIRDTLISTFDANDEGWRFINDVTLSWKSTGGNDVGFLQGSDLGDGRTWYFVSPISWAGDWSSFNTLTYDFKVIDTGDATIVKKDIIRILGVNGEVMTHYEPDNNYPNTTWKNYKIELEPGSFDVTSEVYNSIIQNVKELWIRGEYTDGLDIEGLDNVVLSNQNTLYVLNDIDSDGVIDQWDECIQTSNNSAVYSNGCRANNLYSEIEMLKQQINDQKGIIDQKSQMIIDLNSSINEKNQNISDLNVLIESMYSLEQMEKMVQNILEWGDTNGDGKIGLQEAIKALMVTSGLTE